MLNVLVWNDSFALFINLRLWDRKAKTNMEDDDDRPAEI